MITQYLTQLEKQYKAFLRNLVVENNFASIILRGEKNKPATTVDLHKAIKDFQRYEKTNNNKGWTIEWADWSSKKLGNQKWPSKITVATEEDYIFLLQKEKELIDFRDQLATLVHWQPGIRTLLHARPELVLELRNAWPQIQKVVDYLLLHDVSQHYIRSIPVPVHSKFMENHKQVIAAVIKSIMPEKFSAEQITLEQMLNIQPKPQLYTLRWLDPAVSENYMHGMEVTGVTVEWLCKLNWDIKEVWLVENETNLYLIPQRKDAIAIFSRGYAMSALGQIPFFTHVQLYYWGDLDEDGFIMLNTMHRYYQNLKSIFMNEQTLLQHAAEFDLQSAKYRATDLNHLTHEERAAFNILKRHNGRLEQERIRQNYIMQQLSELS